MGKIHETQPSRRPPDIPNAYVWSVAARLGSHVQSTYAIASDLRSEQLIARVYTRCSTKRFAHVCSYYWRGEHFNVASIAEQEQAQALGVVEGAAQVPSVVGVLHYNLVFSQRVLGKPIVQVGAKT